MQNYKLTLEYEGLNYNGFQIQKNGNTIQAEIEKALQKLFHQQIRIISCGRTDSGVHALGHVINFKVDTKIKDDNILKALNRYLPLDIVVKKVQKVPLDFHAQYDAKGKVYEYTIINQLIRSPLRDRYAHRINQELDVAAMKKAMKALEGKHDFRSFASKTSLDKNTVRTIYKAQLVVKKNQMILRFEGNGFLYNMVRNMVGTVLDVGMKKTTVTDFKKILQAKDRTQAGPIVPAKGLLLKKVSYL